jgi:S-adenosyl-L-methionine hydrolase (adenosine-forming)
MRFETVSFLSDYGHADEFVGVVHSVIRSLAPHVAVVDLVHDLPAHDVRAGSLALVRAIQYVAPGVVLAVVDPGVGTARHAVALEVGDGSGVLIGPDNGLLAPAVSMSGGATRAFALTNTALHLPSPGPTFAGRDIFAPVAAHLCNGVPLEEVGDELDPQDLLPGVVPLPTVNADGSLDAEVLWVDRFGNCQLNVGPEEVEAFGDRVSLRCGGANVRTAVKAETYDELAAGQVGLIVDSYGLLSVAFARSPVAAELNLRAGDPVRLSAPT